MKTMKEMTLQEMHERIWPDLTKIEMSALCPTEAYIAESGVKPYIRADRVADAFNCISDCYQFLDAYGTVYDAGDSRGEKQQELLDRMRGLITLVADLPTTQEQA